MAIMPISLTYNVHSIVHVISDANQSLNHPTEQV